MNGSSVPRGNDSRSLKKNIRRECSRPVDVVRWLGAYVGPCRPGLGLARSVYWELTKAPREEEVCATISFKGPAGLNGAFLGLVVDLDETEIVSVLDQDVRSWTDENGSLCREWDPWTRDYVSWPAEMWASLPFHEEGGEIWLGKDRAFKGFVVVPWATKSQKVFARQMAKTHGMPLIPWKSLRKRRRVTFS